MNLTVAADAPAFQEGLPVYRVIAEPNPPLQGAEEEVEFQVTAGFSGDVAVSLPEGERVTAQGGFVTEVPLVIENRGNGELLLTFRVNRQPAESKITLPQDVPLSSAPGNRTTTALVGIQVPWKVSEEGAVEIEVIPSHAQRGVTGPTQTVEFQLEGRSAIPIPGLGPWLALAAVVVAGWLGRSTRPR